MGGDRFLSNVAPAERRKAKRIHAYRPLMLANGDYRIEKSKGLGQMSKSVLIIVIAVVAFFLFKIVVSFVLGRQTAGIVIDTEANGLSISIDGSGLQDVLIRVNGAHEVRYEALESGRRSVSAERIFGSSSGATPIPRIESVELSAQRDGKLIELHCMFAEARVGN